MEVPFFWLNCDFDIIKSYHADQRPDLVFHKRGINALNFLVVEVKRTGNREEFDADLTKIENEWLTAELEYDFGASVVIDERDHSFEIRLLARGHPRDLTPFTAVTFPQPLHLLPLGDPAREVLHAHADNIAAALSANPQPNIATLKEQLARSVRALYPQAV